MNTDTYKQIRINEKRETTRECVTDTRLRYFSDIVKLPQKAFEDAKNLSF